jgi:hypothetical protein
MEEYRAVRDEKPEDKEYDEAIELIEEEPASGEPASSVSKPRRGVLWGAL